MPQLLRIRQTLHYEYAAAFRESDAVGSPSVSLALTIRGQLAMPTELYKDCRRGVDSHTAGQRQIALAGA